MAKNGGLIKGVKGMAMMSSGMLIDYIVGLVITYVLARLLTQADYGEVAAITVLVRFADIFWQMGVGAALVQKKDATETDIITAQTLNYIFGISIFAVINLFTGFWTNVFSITDPVMLRVYSLVFVLNSCIATPMALAQRKCNFKLLTKINVWGVLFYAVIVIALAKIGMGPWSLVYATLLRYILKLIMLVANIKVKFKFAINKQAAKGLLHFGGGHTLSRLFNYIANNGDTFVVNKTLTKADVGLYSRAYNLLGYPTHLIGDALDYTMFPILSKAQDDMGKIRKFFYTGSAFMALITIPLSVTCVGCCEDLVLFFLGKGWTSIIMPFNILIAALFFRIEYKISDIIMKSLGKEYQRSVIQMIYAVNVVIGAYVGHFSGLTGVAFYVTLAFVLNYFITTGVCMCFIKASLIQYIKSVISPILYGGVMYVICYFAKDYLNAVFANHFLTCVVWTVFVFSIYAVMFLLTRKWLIIKDANDAFDEIAGSLLSKVFKKK